MRLAILDLLTIKTARHSAFRSRRQVLLATIAVLFLNSCRSATEPCTDCWTTKASMLTPDVEFGVGVMNGILYAVGAVVQAYDPVANSWTTKASMPTRRGGLGVGVVNGVLYAVGGEDGLYHCPFGGAPGPGPFLGVVEAYDPVANTWTTKASMPTPRARFGVGVTNGPLRRGRKQLQRRRWGQGRGVRPSDRHLDEQGVTADRWWRPARRRRGWCPLRYKGRRREL